MVHTRPDKDVLYLLDKALDVHLVDKVKHVDNLVSHLRVVEFLKEGLEPLLCESETLHVNGIQLTFLGSDVFEEPLGDLMSSDGLPGFDLHAPILLVLLEHGKYLFLLLLHHL